LAIDADSSFLAPVIAMVARFSGQPQPVRPPRRYSPDPRKEASMSILWIILIVVLVLALLGFLGFR
jgi:type VI protein secretion system component VasF